MQQGRLRVVSPTSVSSHRGLGTLPNNCVVELWFAGNSHSLLIKEGVMKRLIALLLNAVVVMAFIGTPSQAQWHEVPVTRPEPEGSYVWNAIFFVDAFNGWVASDNSNFVAHTSDGGRTWQPRLLPVPSQPTGFGGIFFSDVNHGIMAGKSGYGNGPGIIIRTTHGGLTWSQVTHPAANSQWEEIALVGDSLWVVGS